MHTLLWRGRADNNNDVAHEKKNEPVTGPVSGDEFENAVTTAIPGTVARAFDQPSGRDVEVLSADISPVPQSADDEIFEPGFVLSNRFEIVELVHSGGMSHVYKAIDRRRSLDGAGQIHVGIKVMRQSLASEQDARLSIEREATRAQRLSHPNIVNVYDFDQHEGYFFLVMEWLEGESVNELLRRVAGQRLDQSFAWQIIEGAAAGIQHAHLHNVVHADINPSNVFITNTHEIKLLDFGVARNLSDRSDIEENRLLWATKAYASPEVLSELAPVVEDDIFSLGCFAYRLLGGEHPFAGALSIEAKKNNVEIAPIAGLHENDWQSIRRALDYSRTNRPKSAAVFYRSTQHPALVEASDDSPATEPWQWLLGTAVVATLIAVSAWWLWNTPDVLPVDGGEPAVVAEAQAPGAGEATGEPAPASPIGPLLDAAEGALADDRLIAPTGDNAREMYRQVLELEPGNVIAQSGLRSISDRYVRQAEASLRSGSPEDSATALAIAADTDPGNPAIEIVDYLLVSESSQLLANARAAALSGNVGEASNLLANAERYGRASPDELAAVAGLIAAANAEQALAGQLNALNQRITDGQLLTPEGDSATDLLLALTASGVDDPRIAASTNRLGERLLAESAIARDAGDFVDAGQMIDAVAELGVLDNAVDAARAALDAAISESLIEAQPLDEISITESVRTTVLVAAEPVQAEPPARRRLSLSELGIERYVAPKYPRSARRSDTSGFVEVGFVVNADGTTSQIEILNAVPRGVFDASAERAVRQWRVTRREAPAEGRVSLSFQPD